jgi:hypothetical protein
LVKKEELFMKVVGLCNCLIITEMDTIDKAIFMDLLRSEHVKFQGEVSLDNNDFPRIIPPKKIDGNLWETIEWLTDLQHLQECAKKIALKAKGEISSCRPRLA